jgi:diguanylate cyclase (GGDEF)-like protein
MSGFALLYIDLDKFKVINDTKGHAFGDAVLVEVALRLKQSIRNSDTVARVGGDEFVLILENISNKNKVSEMAAVLIKALNKPCMIKNQQIELSCSIGLAIYPEDGVTTDALLAAADKEMYKTKK